MKSNYKIIKSFYKDYIIKEKELKTFKKKIINVYEINKNIKNKNLLVLSSDNTLDNKILDEIIDENYKNNIDCKMFQQTFKTYNFYNNNYYINNEKISITILIFENDIYLDFKKIVKKFNKNK